MHARSPSDAQSSQRFISGYVLPMAHTLCMHVVPKMSRAFLTLHTDSPEDIKVTLCCANNNTRQLWMPVQLLHVCLATVLKQKLWWNIRLLLLWSLISLNAEVPDGDLVISTRHCKNAGVLRVPFQGGDVTGVLFKSGYWVDGIVLKTTTVEQYMQKKKNP